MAKNKTYYVTVTYTVTRSFTIKAKDEETAIEKAHKLSEKDAEETEEAIEDTEAEEIEEE